MKYQYNKSTAEKIVKQTTTVMESCESNQNLDDTLDRIQSYEYVKTVSDILFNYFRNRARIEFIIAKFAHKGRKKIQPKLKRILNTAVTQILYQSGIESEIATDVAVTYTKKRYGSRPAGFINAILRQISAADITSLLQKAPEYVKMNIPENIFTRWSNSIPDFIKTLPEFSHKKAPLTFRIIDNIPEEELKERECRKIDLPYWADDYNCYAANTPSKLFQTNWLSEGKIYIQDPSTISPCTLYTPKPNDTVLDLCSAPGGKTLILAEKMKKGGFIVSSDVSLYRQYRTAENIDTHNIKHCSIITASALTPPFSANCADLVFLDVPCTNTGVFRKRPDSLWNFTEKKLTELVALQKKILNTTTTLLKDSGSIIYSTCSIEPEENSLQVQNFIKKNPHFRLIKERQLFPNTLHDGGYTALLTCP